MPHSIQTRVRYGETDQMGVVYYGNYLQFYEIGRAEWLRAKGFSYKKLEELGVLMPVMSVENKYIRPAKYDDLLTITTSIKSYDKKSVRFLTEIYNEGDELLHVGTTKLCFINMNDMSRQDAPQVIDDMLSEL